MKKITLIIAIILTTSVNLLGQCSGLFSFAAYFEKVTFINQSNVSNAHYYWNFGDGTSSYLKNPTHEYPDDGSYFATLFVKDTITNCSAYYDYWITVAKYSATGCQPSINDSFFVYNNNQYMKIINNSTNCNSYYDNYDVAGGFNLWQSFWYNFSSAKDSRLIARVQYYDSWGLLTKEGYKSILYNYFSLKNYTPCSANFEFTVVSQDTTGQRFLFKAMNKNATSYEWSIVGFGNPIVSYNDTISQFYTYDSNDMLPITLKTTDASGCHDTLTQQILFRKGLKTYVGIEELSLENQINIYPNPTTSIINIIDETNQLQNTTIQIKNYLGQTVFTTPFTSQIDLHNFSAGMYFLTVQDKGHKKTVKIVKE